MMLAIINTTTHFYFAFIGGLVAMLISAVLWAVITVATQFQIGFMAIGVGLLVGYSVQYFDSPIILLWQRKIPQMM